jgi:putative restriction endonuclease
MPDPDADVRLAAFQVLAAAQRLQAGPLPWSVLKDGFDVRGQHFGFASQAEGIYRPKGMSGLLSVKTVVPREGRQIWYHDQVDPELLSPGDTFSYAFKGTDPDTVQNQWLNEAMEQQLPIIYFYGVAPALYDPLFPAFVTEWDPACAGWRGRHSHEPACDEAIARY